jgi:DNA adenine methylase
MTEPRAYVRGTVVPLSHNHLWCSLVRVSACLADVATIPVYAARVSADERPISPFLRWPGGKRWLVEQHPHIFPKRFSTYIEPFLGAGSVYFHLRPERAVLGDLNRDLVIAYQGIRSDPAGVQVQLERHQVCHSKEYYYEIRESVPVSLTGQAARIVYLNRTCFNGIYRVNRQGHFNVPIGTRDQVVRDTDNFAGIATLLAGADLLHSDFEPLIDTAQAGDLVFVDPPYTVRHNRNGFIKYNERLFSWDDQERLAKAVTRAAERGAYVTATNASHPTVRELYSAKLFRFQEISRFSAISASLDSRKRFDELIIRTKQPRRSRGTG